MVARGRDWRGYGCAAAAGALVAFPLGLMVAGREAPERPPAAARTSGPERGKAGFRNVYSPNLSEDPYVLSEQRRVVEALEAECRNQRTHCAEAEQARRWITERRAAD